MASKSLAARVAALEALEDDDRADDAIASQIARLEQHRADVDARMAAQRRDWRPPIRIAQIDLLAAALGDGRLCFTLRDDHSPTWYCFLPPAPLSAGCWETPHYLAGKAAERTLREFQNLFAGAMPADAAGVIQWLQECEAYYAQFIEAAICA